MSLKLDVVTPEKILISEGVEQVVVPGEEGEFGVLVNHAPVISALKPGVVRVLDAGNKITKRVLITGGFVEVTTERCTILATEAHDFDKVSREELEKRLTATKKIHDEAKEEHKKKALADDVHVAQEIVDAFVRECDSKK